MIMVSERKKAMTCYRRSSQRDTDGRNIQAKIGRQCVVIATFSAPQEVKFTSSEFASETGGLG